MKANNTTYTETITEVEAITGAKVVAITKEDSAFNSDFVLLDNDGEITQAFFTRDINGKISVNACYGSNSIPEALTYLNMSEEELSQNIEFINPNNTTPETTDTMNTETMTEKEETKSVNDIMNQANRLMSECNAKRNFKRADAIRKITFRYFDNIRACAGSFDSNNDAEYNKQYTRAQYMNEANIVTVTISPDDSNLYTATVNGVEVGSVNTWFNNTFAAVYNFGIRTRKGLAMPELDNREEAAHGFMTKANAVLWLGDMITRYFSEHGINAKIVNV